MIKLKLNRDELQCLFWLTNPVYIEAKVCETLKNEDFMSLEYYFSLMEIGQKAAKKFLFDHKKSYKINLTYAQAAAFWSYSEWNKEGLDEYRIFVLQNIKSTIHDQLTNYQKQYYETGYTASK